MSEGGLLRGMTNFNIKISGRQHPDVQYKPDLSSTFGDRFACILHDSESGSNNPVILGPLIQVFEMWIIFKCIDVWGGHTEKTKCPNTHVRLKFSLCFVTWTTHLKYGRLFQKHPVCVHNYGTN
jgi:hypothetical protein